MSFRKLPNGSPSSFSSRKHNGLDVDTLIEGSAIDVSSSKQQRSKNNTRDRLIKNSSNETVTKDLSNYKEKYINLQNTIHGLRNELKVKTKLLCEVEFEHKNEKEQYEKESQKLTSSVESLQREVANLKKDYTMKEANIKENIECYDTTVVSLKDEIKALKSIHADTLSSIVEKHSKEIKLLKKRIETEKYSVLKEFDEKLTSKQDIIDNLKAKLAESFTESSKERQIQIDELVKELERVSVEAESVKSALKSLKTTSACQRCTFYDQKIKELTKELTEKDDICRTLYMICSKMEKQLIQQDDVLQVWSNVKKQV